MIISCPECSGPFQIPDDQIAALVQVECPQCTFRMILDFEAANDPSLVEAGMRMASGYPDAASYHAAAPAASPAERPAAAVDRTPATAEPRVHEPPAHERATPEPLHAPVSAAAAAAPADPSATPPREPTSIPAERPRPSVPAGVPAQARTGATVVGLFPPPPAHRGADDEEPSSTNDEDLKATVEHPSSEQRRDLDAPRAAELAGGSDSARDADQDAASARQDRPPPHTPPVAAAATKQSGPEPAAPVRPELLSNTDLEASKNKVELARRPKRRWPAYLAALILILIAGVIAASYALHGTLDPRPMLEDVYRQVWHQLQLQLNL